MPARILVVAIPLVIAQVAVPLIAPDEDEEPIVDPVAQASAPRAPAGQADRPDIPDLPDRFAAMAFENRSPVHALDWLTAGAPLALSEKVEANLRLEPAYGAWVVPTGPVIVATPD